MLLASQPSGDECMGRPLSAIALVARCSTHQRYCNVGGSVEAVNDPIAVQRATLVSGGGALSVSPRHRTGGRAFSRHATRLTVEGCHATADAPPQ